MKRGLAFLVFSILVLSSSAFAQNLRSSQMSVDSQKSIVVYGGTRAFSDGRGVWLEWQTTSETKNLGFSVYRLVGDKKEPVSTNLIGGSYLRAAEEQTVGGGYSYFDPNGNGYDTYFIQSLDTNGRTQFSEAIYPQFIGDIKTVAGRSALEMTDNASKATPVVQENKTGANDLVPDLPMQRWVAGQPGARIGIKKEGFYRVSRNELQSAGFDVNSSPAFWRLFLNGNEQSIIVEPNGDYIEFYGYGLDVRETDTQVYFLITGTTNGRRIQTVTPPNNPGGFTANYDYSKITKYRSLFISSILNGDEDNYFGGSHIIASATGVNVNFELPNFDCDALSNPTDPTLPCNAKALYLNVRVQGLTQTSHSIVVELNGIQIGTMSGTGYQQMELPNINRKLKVLTPGLVNAGTNTIRLATTGVSGDVSLLDSVEVGFRRKFIAQDNQLSFFTRDSKKSRVRGFSSPNVRVFDLINPDEPARLDVPIVQEDTTYRVDLPANTPRAIYTVEDSAISQAAWVVPNTPSALATTGHNAQFIIVTHKNFTTEANAWAAFRMGQGLQTEVVQVDDIFDEFNYGASDSLALRNFFQYAKDNWTTPPQYILLLGDASYDYRNYEGLGYNSYVPTRMVDTVYMETGSDETLADFNNDGLAEIAIGRIPARIGADVTQAMFKTNAFEQQLANWTNRGALFAFDQPIGYDFDALSQRIASHLPAGMPKTFIGRTLSTVVADQEANQLELINSMTSGKYLVNYSGHGSVIGWTSSSRFFWTTNLQVTAPTSPPAQPVVRNVNNFSIYMMLTCLNGYFIQNTGDSLSEKLLKAKWFEEVTPGNFTVHEVGAAASWTSSGKTTPDVQEVMATRFLQQVTLGNLTRFGDLVKDAKTSIIGGRDVRLSWVLLGDPTMKLR